MTDSGSPKIAQSLADFLSLEQMLAMSGLEYMTGILEGRTPSAPISRLMGFALNQVASGRIVFRGAPEFDTLNPLGTVHGGWYGTILDSAMACAVMTKLPKGPVYTTLEYKVNLIRAVPLGTLVDCIGETDHVGRSTGVASGRLVGVETGTLYATGSTTCLVMPMG